MGGTTEKLNLRTRKGREEMRRRRAGLCAALEEAVRQQRLGTASVLDVPPDDFSGCEQIPPGLDQLPDHKWPSRQDERQPYWVEN